MEPIKTIIISILSLSALVFVALFGRLPVFRKTPIGALHRLLRLHIPRSLARLDRALTGGCLTRTLHATNHYLLYEPHPLVALFFFTLLISGQAIFIPPAWPHVSTLHHLLIPLLCSLPYLFLHLGNITHPSITPSNHPSAMRHYPYDRTLFYPGQICRTCHLPKPPRSKHCSLCKSCIARMDHHCIWLNNCVGKNNYHYFLLLLLSTTLLCVYGAYLGFSILSPLITKTSFPTSNTRRTWSSTFHAYLNVISFHPRLGSVTLLCTLSSPLPFGLFLYHIYLLWAGMTTNESEKWADLRDDIADGLVWKAERAALLGDYPRLRDGGLEPEGKEVRWPVREGRWWVCRMREEGERPRVWVRKDGEGGDGGGEGGEMVAGGVDERWVRVRSLAEVDNVYDLGFWGNLGDVLWNREM
ncbi:MAG: hypothetical protein Q9227_005023 [Pyrenula ochraceoflavens]